MRVICCLLLFALFLSLGGCATVGHHEVGIENFDRVSDSLFRGGQPTEQGFRTLADMHVKTIINLRDSDDSREARWVHDAGMTYIHLPLDAETVTPADADKFLALLAHAPAPAFVHCLQGRDRTGMAVAAYRVRIEDWSVKAAVIDLNNHGHFWLLFPHVRAAIAGLGHVTPGTDIAAAPSADPASQN